MINVFKTKWYYYCLKVFKMMAKNFIFLLLWRISNFKNVKIISFGNIIYFRLEMFKSIKIGL